MAPRNGQGSGTLGAVCAVAVLIGGCGIDDRFPRSRDGAAIGAADATAERSAAAVHCMSAPPARALITDFSDAVPGVVPDAGNPDINFGTAPNLTGGTYLYYAVGLVPPSLSLISSGHNQALQIVADPGVPKFSGNNWVGFGLFFDGCVDASAYRGVQFTMGGALGSCQLSLFIGISEDQSSQYQTGLCRFGAGCQVPQVRLGGLGTQTIAFTQLAAGSPVPRVDSMALVGLQWQLTTPNSAEPCQATLTLDDISFVAD
jgi:hypothetical protein